MQNYTNNNPSFSSSISIPENTDPANAEEVLNLAPKQLLDNDLVIHSNLAEEYSELETYAVGAIRSHNGVTYKCDIAVTEPEAFDSTKWTRESLGHAIENAGGGGAEDVGLSVVDGKVCITYEE
ncbi:MAG: hypothetical protein K6G60_10250 [Lachnospiraceae bacterium]|nr:hypothetical protein [Lachnospiraceae bacterium]